MAGRVFINATVNWLREDNETVVATNYPVQIDNNNAESETMLDHMHLTGKLLYDTPSAREWERGDVVIITSSYGHPNAPQDSRYYVKRANKRMGMLSGVEVGLLGGRVCDCVLSVQRRDAVLQGAVLPVEDMQNRWVSYMAPDKFADKAWGRTIGSMILDDETSTWKVGDIITVSYIAGWPSVDQVAEYSVNEVTRHATPVPHVQVQFDGTFQ